MKILILPSWYPNNVLKTGSFFKEQASFLNDNGFEVKVLIPEELYTKSIFFHKIKRLIKGATKKLSTSYLEQGPEAFSFPVIIQKGWSAERKLQALDKTYLKAFKTLVLSQNWFPDIIHLQGMYQLGLSSYLIAETYQLPLVVIEHSPFRINNYKPEYQERIKQIFEKAEKIAGVSHFHKTCLSAVNSKQAVEVVWNFMDEEKFRYVPSLKSDDKFIITTILRASSVKDPMTFFDAIAKFIQGFKDEKSVEVYVVGLSCLDDLIGMKGIDSYFISKYEGLEKFLKFYPWLDREEILALHQRSSVFVSTSMDEPYGVAIREAMLCGTPVISTKSGGPEDTIGIECGLLVEVGDSGAIADLLLALYNGTIVFKGEELRAAVISQSGRKAFLRRMEAFYNL